MRRFESLILLFLPIFLFGQISIPNHDFELKDPASNTLSAYWKAGGTYDVCSIDSINSFKGKYSLRVSKKTTDGFASFQQDLPFKSEGARKFRISAAIKIKNVKEKYAGAFVKITGKNGNIICRQDMKALNIKGTKEWKVYEAEIYTDEGADKIRIAGLLYGSGEAWFDDFSIKEIPLSGKSFSKAVDNYIDSYFDIVRANSLIKDSAYLSRLQGNTKELCKGSTTPDHCHSVLKNYTTNKLNDGHSFFLTPQEWKDWQNGDKAIEQGLANFAMGKILSNNIAYLSIPTFVSLDDKLISRYIDSLQKTIEYLDKQNPAGWIIDISKNMGGNSWAMVCGLGPLLGNGVCGYSISANGNKMTRIYNNGWAGWDTTMMLKKSNPYHLIKPNIPIAVIYGDQTASAGEVVAIAFRGKQNTRSFGQQTSGATTRVDNFELSDKAYLNLASGVDADRNGVKFGGKIMPDKLSQNYDLALVEAIRWLTRKPE